MKGNSPAAKGIFEQMTLWIVREVFICLYDMQEEEEEENDEWKFQWLISVHVHRQNHTQAEIRKLCSSELHAVVCIGSSRIVLDFYRIDNRRRRENRI